ncbi:DUF6898 family protein [Paradevosia shaoguanensis]|uniref:DUF6898 family protein n=1 Tax=Paradevosia shaoguanensis TaxID=1335043 RepID=UPI003C772AA2
MGEREVLFEFTQIGQQMRVSAIDADTKIEVIVITPVTASRYQMQALAMAKLKRRLAESEGQGGVAPQRLF